MENKRISLRQLPDLIKKITGAKNVRIKKFVDKNKKVYEGEELKALMEQN